MSLYCPRCDTANRAGSVYCNRCGQPLGEPTANTCRACGAANLAAARFCHRCGSRLPVAELNVDDMPADLSPEPDEPAEADVPTLEIPPGSAPADTAAEAQKPGDDLLATMAAALGPLPGAKPSGAAPSRAADLHVAPLSLPAAPPEQTFDQVISTDGHVDTQTSARSDGATTRRNLATRILYIALVIAILLPFLVPGEWSGATIPLSPSTAAFYQSVVALRPGTPVLLAFDYDTSTRSELDAQAQAVVAHLMQRGVRMIAMSLLPQGPALADEVLQRAAPGQNYRMGDDYSNLGYVPGGSAGLNRLATSVQTAASGPPPGAGNLVTGTVMQGVKGVESVGAIVVFAADEPAALLWITQIQARYRVRLLIGASASAATQLQPYVSNGQIQGLLAGLPGAAEYELLMNQPGQAVKMLDAQSLAHGVLVVAILLGNLAYVVSSVRRKRMSPGQAAK